jgi:hypothetical protein
MASPNMAHTLLCGGSALDDPLFSTLGCDDDSAATGSIPPACLSGSAAPLAAALVSDQPLDDDCFDQLLPADLRLASSVYWTPLEVVRRASQWLEQLGIRSVVDIGSGVGKFCIAGALATRCTFTGVEHRPHLTVVARQLSRAFGVQDRVSIVDGRFGEVALPRADCYYLYNPFEENLSPPDEALDHRVELSIVRFRGELRAFRSLVSSLPRGAYVLAYNGVGGRWPDCLEPRRVDRGLPAVLRLFQKGQS